MEPMSRPDGERIAMLEQHMKDQDDVLKQIVSDVKDIKTIVSRQDGYENRIQKLEQKNDSWAAKYLNPLIAGVLGSVITFLVISYLQHLKQ